MSRLLLFVIIIYMAAWRAEANNFCGPVACEGIVFTENRSRIADMDGNPRPDILYSARRSNTAVYFRASGLSYVFASQNPDSSATIERIDVDFHGASAEEIIAAEPSGGVSNFYLANCPEGITGVRNFGKIIYKNIYNNIDARFYSDPATGNLKYDFVVRPGGDPRLIRLIASGAEAAIGSDGAMTISSANSILNEQRPYTYIAGKSDRPLKSIGSKWLIEDNQIRFDIDNYDSTKTLVIDPMVIWSTYFGGMSGDHANCLKLDGDNHFLITGNTLSENFPVTPGAFKTEHGDIYDAYVARMDPAGNLRWSTFYGGSEAEYCNSVTSDNRDNVIIAGWSWSDNFPTTEGAFQRYKAGGDMDCFVAKFDSSGKRLFATLVGSGGDEHIYGLATDSKRNIFIGGWTNSVQFPVPDDAYQKFKGPKSDAFIMKLSEFGDYLWATFLGGRGDEVCQALVLDPEDMIIMTGSTSSRDFPNTGTVPHPGGTDKDIFVTKFDNNGFLEWSRIYGMEQDDFANDIKIDGDQLIITGNTRSRNFPVGPDAIQDSTSGGGMDILIMSVDMKGERKWSTLFGGSRDDYANAVSIDSERNILIAGHSNSPDFPTTPGSFMREFSGNFDAIASKFSPNCKSVEWSTYIGGSDNEWGWGIAVDDSLNVVVCGDTESPDFPISLPPFQPELGGDIDGFIVKLCRTSPYPVIEIEGDSAFCSGEGVMLDAGAEFRQYLWSTGETTRKIEVTESGEFYVLVTDSVGCKAESDAVRLTVWEVDSLELRGVRNICGDEDITIFAEGNFEEFHWSNGSNSASITINRPGNYSVTAIDSNGCVRSSEFNIERYPVPEVHVEGPDEVCANSGPIRYTAEYTSLMTYRWSAEGGEIDDSPQANATTVRWGDAGIGRVILTKINSKTQCSAIDTLEVTIGNSLRPVITSDIGRLTACEGDTLVLDAGMGYDKYKWSTGKRRQAIAVTQSGKYWCKVETANGCSGADTVDVIFHPNPRPEISGPAEVCHSETAAVEYTSSGSGTFEWSVEGGEIIEGQGGERVLVNFYEKNSQLSVIQTDENTGCSGSSERFNVIIHENPEARIIADANEFCTGDSVRLEAPAGYKHYEWSDGSRGKYIYAKSGGIYSVTITNEHGCQASATVSLNERPLPAEFALERRGDTLFAPEGYEYNWFKNSEKINNSGDYLLPDEDDTYYVEIINEYGCSRKSEGYDYIKFVPRSVLVALPDTSVAAAGNMIKIPMQLLESTGIEPGAEYPFTAHLTYDRRIMVAARSYDRIGETRETITIETSGILRKSGIECPLEFYSALGPVACAPVIIDTVIFTGERVDARTRNGVFCVAELCNADGLRLYFDTGDLQISVIPNPFDSEIIFEFELIESGQTRLAIYNYLGEEIEVIMDENADSGEREVRFDGSHLPAGIYLYQLKTPTHTIGGKIYRLE
ncbi:MAG: SBBP repeat-containing protein [Candidatus Kapaibacterium sp.]